jgi:hypothetical protein
MVQRLREFFFQDAPNWMLAIVGGLFIGAMGLVTFASVAAADQHNDARYVKLANYQNDQSAESLVWKNHIEMEELKTKPVLEKVEELHKQVEQINAQLSHNNAITERNNAILERLEKR